MNALKVTRWELRRILRSKQFWIMTLIVPAMIGLAAFAAAQSNGLNELSAEAPPPFVFAIALAMVLFVAAFLSGVMMLYGVIKEKNSRVVEIVLSSISARELMAGKVLGQGLAGLLSVAIWIAIGLTLAGRFVPLSFAVLTPLQWAMYPLYFVFGYLLMGSLYATAGAAMKDLHSGSVQALIGIVPYLPMIFLSFIIEHPDALWVRLAGFFPPFTPSVMMFRMAMTDVAWWEALLALLVLAAFVLLLMRFAARVFETALLMTGKSASLRELWRWGVRGR